MKLVFVHGVGNASATAETLRGDWIRALESGGLDPALIQGADPVMAYYADLLDTGAGKASLNSWKSFEPAKVKFMVDVAAQVSAAYMKAAIRENADVMRKVPSELVPHFAQKAYRDLALGPGQEILDFVRDVVDEVYDYLTKPVLRASIDARVEAQLVDGPMIIVAHSLGSVVAYRLLRERGRPGLAQSHLISLGSPLRMMVALRVLDGAFTYPAQMGSWLNVFDPLDMVALGAALPKPAGAGQKMTQFRVNNPHITQHYATGYLPTGPIIRLLRAQL